MNRRRTSNRTLTGTRIYTKRGKFWYFAPEPMLNPATGKVAKWHALCAIEEGEARARQILAELLGHVTAAKGAGDLCAWFDKWRTELFARRDQDAPKDPVRRKIWDKSTKALTYSLGVIETAFADFDIDQVRPADVATFLDQWDGKRAAQDYRGKLSAFFAWCCRRGLLNTNPAREVTIKPPKKRTVYISDAQYLAVKADLLAGDPPDHNRAMVAALMDMYYLVYQRGTDVRLLPWNALEGDTIEFKPTKTEKTSGASVVVPVTDEMRQIGERLKQIRKLRSTFLFHDERGQPLDARHVRDIFKRACDRVNVHGITLKDVRSKAASDAKAQGYTEQQIKTALAHTEERTTRGYIRQQAAPVSEVILRLPKG